MWEMVVSLKFWPLYHRVKSPRYPWNWALDGLKGRSGLSEKQNIIYTSAGSRTMIPPMGNVTKVTGLCRLSNKDIG